IEKRSVDRIRHLPRNITMDFELSAAQEKAFAAIHDAFLTKTVCLLHGVTSSGKTLVYIRLIEEMLRAGKQVLYMLPEIALTSQIIRRLQRNFGGYVTVYHSRFNQNERVEIWNKVKTGEAKIILGARSSLFLPFKELGLVICDEEHDPSFKQQDPAPRYHARDTAIYFASLYHAKVVLGSATPSLESYYNAYTGKYGFSELQERYGAVAMPRIEIIDTRKVPTEAKAKVIISPQLKEAIEQCVERDKQVILFQNRRGYSPYQVCQSCGWIPHCKYCDVSLTYHKITHKLQCHYCGTVYSTVHTCEACGNHHFIQQNFGTERIEEELQELFPAVKMARMDIDTIKGKNAHDSLIQSFEQGKLSILVGTQMVVKGLDFENVELVGILDGDAILGFTDFRVNERAFQLMEQVSGRAGRKHQQGHVLLQIRNVNHPLLAVIQQHDYRRFFLEEIDNRKQFFYPPFSRIILLRFRHRDAQIVAQAALAFSGLVKAEFSKYMVGPAQPVVSRVRSQYIMELMFKLPKDGTIINSCKQNVLQNIALLHQEKKYRSVQVVIDVDAV
ncbi:MAG: primosomal protein N', partial [Chitinophagaceae bacterium]|nr:primosomal protein N' [Chitinophagaceae bacterium]